MAVRVCYGKLLWGCGRGQQNLGGRFTEVFMQMYGFRFILKNGRDLHGIKWGWHSHWPCENNDRKVTEIVNVLCSI